MNLVDRMMNEVKLYGGVPMRRCDIYTLATEHLGKHARDRFGADYFAFSGDAVEGVAPLPLDVARRIHAGEATKDDEAAFARAFA